MTAVKRVAIVTGASSGIGTAVARALSAAGWEVHALARRAERLQALAAEAGVVPHAVDVRDGAAVERLTAGLEAELVVNNAGLGAGFTGLATASREDVAQTIGTNVTAVLELLRLTLPGMIARGRGQIVNIGSVAGLYPTVSAIYGASKGAVRLMGQSLRLELRGTGVRITEICPGRVSTEFYDAAVPDADLRSADEDDRHSRVVARRHSRSGALRRHRAGACQRLDDRVAAGRADVRRRPLRSDRLVGAGLIGGTSIRVAGAH